MTPGTASPTWDDELVRADGHFLQSTHWQAFQEAVGRETVHAAGAGWSWSAILHRAGPVRYLYAPYGPTAGDAGFSAAIDDLRRAAAELRCDFVRIEPPAISASALRDHGAVQVAAVQPEHTWMIDLRPAEEELLRGFSQLRRRNLRAAGRDGVTVRRSTDPGEVETFIDLIHATAERNHFHPHPDDYYRTMARVLMARGAATLYVAEREGTPLAAVITFDFGPMRAYAHAAADPRHRDLGAPTPLVWQMMRDAKAEGRTRWDFWGALPDDSNPDHPWAGFSRFKRSFGGELRSFPGTWELPRNRLRRRLYHLARRLR